MCEIKNIINIQKLINIYYSQHRNELYVNDFQGKCICSFNFNEDETNKDDLIYDGEPVFYKVYQIVDDIVYSHFLYFYNIEIYTIRIQNSMSSIDSLWQLAFECTNFSRLEYCFALSESEAIDIFYTDVYEEEYVLLSIKQIK